MQHLLDPNLIKVYKKDKEWLEQAEVPIVTLAGTTREDIKGWHGLPEDETLTDVVLSRAHFSMALAIATEIWGKQVNYHKAWLVDPTNYVSQEKWRSIILTENVGKALARNPMLKSIKDLVDRFGRQKLPILDSITPPLLYLTEHINKPILSLHVAAGNILLEHGKTVLQVITDPHVRYDYLTEVDNSKLTFCVFDQLTKDDLLEKVALQGKSIDPKRVIVTGPPIDPRVFASRTKKHPWRSGKLNLCITTGGLGTNKKEIVALLEQLLPIVRSNDCNINLLVYCGTQKDLYTICLDLARQNAIQKESIDNPKANFRCLYHPQIVDANEQLIKYAFPWADGIISKPSGDMAYDAVASGSFLLTLKEWGEWESVIRERFENMGIARPVITEQFVAQLDELMSAKDRSSSWVERAMLAAAKIPANSINGTAAIIKAHRQLMQQQKS